MNETICIVIGTVKTETTAQGECLTQSIEKEVTVNSAVVKVEHTDGNTAYLKMTGPDYASVVSGYGNDVTLFYSFGTMVDSA